MGRSGRLEGSAVENTATTAFGVDRDGSSREGGRKKEARSTRRFGNGIIQRLGTSHDRKVQNSLHDSLLDFNCILVSLVRHFSLLHLRGKKLNECLN